MNDNLHSIRLEQSILCNMLTAGKGFDSAFEKLTPEVFFYNKHAVLFNHIQELRNRGESFDVEVVIDSIRLNAADSQLVTREFIEELFLNAPSTYATDAHADKLVEHSRRRSLFAAGDRIQRIASDTSQYTFDEAVSESEGVIASLDKNEGESTLFSAFDLSVDLFASIDQRMRDRAKGIETIDGVKTGFADLDKQIGTIAKADLVIIAARPSMGKTALAQDMMLYISFMQQHPVLFQSAEMSAKKVGARLVSSIAEINSRDIRDATVPDLKWESFTKATDRLKNSRLVIDDKSAPTLSDIRRNCRKIKAKYGYVGAVFIDYLTLLTSPLKTEQNHLAVGAISKGLKAIAKEFDCPVFALSQLSRGVESRGDKRPMLSDLRESGQIEQDADVILFIYRDEYYNKDSKEMGIAEIIAAKVRDGEVGTVRLATELQYSRFSDLDAHYYQGLESVGGGV